MAWSKWRLIRVATYDSKRSAGILKGEVQASFFREQPRRGGKQAKKEWVTISVEADGLTNMYRNMVLQGMKSNKRDRVHRLCCQAVAYHELMGSVEGFPEQEFL